MSHRSRGPIELSSPSREEQEISARLTAVIEQEIALSGSISFARFMELALYTPGLGYYAGGKSKLGAAGDFITAPESYPLFARCLAHTAIDVLQALGGGDILEVGAGSGKLAASLLAELAARNALPDTYYILDISADLRALQAQTLRAQVPQLFERVRWLDSLPTAGFRGLVIGNELLDAMPVERFRVDADQIRQLRVARQGGQFVWTDGIASEAIRERVAPLALASDYESEISLAAEAWVRSIADVLTAGVLLLIDYGFPRAEYYHAQRNAGTLMCHYRHHAHADPLILVGLQDITAHVDFTGIAEAAHDSGLGVLGYTSQAAFLIASGIGELITAPDTDVRAHLALTDQIKKLTLPHEMGELFKVIALGRGLERPLRAFALQDRRGRL
ncbi:MAG: SAM-dependent methyltransferase [Gammaproteobacteria bacterium]|nr:SAM-dependent methyltransferase [Gammaproteobacteria bacterium]